MTVQIKLFHKILIAIVVLFGLSRLSKVKILQKIKGDQSPRSTPAPAAPRIVRVQQPEPRIIERIVEVPKYIEVPVMVQQPAQPREATPQYEQRAVPRMPRSSVCMDNQQEQRPARRTSVHVDDNVMNQFYRRE
jgi:hypothetical protein